MHAAVFYQPGSPLSIESVDNPQPKAGHVVIAVKRCGICGTDLHATVGFADFANAFESLRTPNAHRKIMLDPSG